MSQVPGKPRDRRRLSGLLTGGPRTQRNPVGNEYGDQPGSESGGLSR